MIIKFDIYNILFSSSPSFCTNSIKRS